MISKSTSYYVGKFRLNEENFQFNREAFLYELEQEFIEKLDAAYLTAARTTEGFTYSKFKNCIKEMEDKFWSISNKKIGEPLTKQLWSAFFAVYIIKHRKLLFPIIEKEISEKRERYMGEDTIHA